ncbi:MAG: hypothetical protein CSB24_04645 [Deltaproteobacteria bacterium]|nr:MAG: hypothetical protein CSB24_04645 [Deltaproteobacteria bacterium]
MPLDFEHHSPYTPPACDALHFGSSNDGPALPKPNTFNGTRIRFRRLRAVDLPVRLVYQKGTGKGDQNYRMPFRAAKARDKSARIPWGSFRRLGRVVRSSWQHFTVYDYQSRVYWSSTLPTDRSLVSGWDTFYPLDYQTRCPWINTLAKIEPEIRLPWQALEPLNRDCRIPWECPPPHDKLHRTYWGQEWYERICTQDYHPPKCGEIHFEHHGSSGQIFAPAACQPLDFIHDTSTNDLRCSQREPDGWRDNYYYQPDNPVIKPSTGLVTPKYLVLYTMNTATLIRVKGGLPVPVFSMNISTDLDSWCWSFTAQISADGLPLVDPTAEPVEVLATINGYSWRFMVESWTEKKGFNQAEYTITGRSPSAELAAPYAPLSTGVTGSTLTSVQIADQQLANTGWTIDFGDFESWLVPAGAFSWNNAAPLKVIQAVAEAAGGRIQTHREQSRLMVRPRLRSLPWKWPGMGFDLAISDYVVRQLSREFMPGVSYNAVFVSGTACGVLCKVYREGTAGDKAAPMVTDALLTDTIPCRSRGRMIIGRSGNWSRETLELPLTAPGKLPGLLETGMLVEMEEGGVKWQGQVAGVAVSAGWQQAGGLTVNQNIKVERYRGN